ncbi:hypothetical protein AVEN_37924-1 [Araneus ventricosus]|uniref:Uncharacterized protein n=1 Tax=Araneus ventricosus TaxID=182803 RepID=A0A4Y2QB75_ARAVE|nr:hypothetical protein AVEN_37924-1 [Araneus ventricosus]
MEHSGALISSSAKTASTSQIILPREHHLEESVPANVSSLPLTAPEAYRHSVLEQSTILTLEGSDWTSESDVTMLCLFVYL